MSDPRYRITHMVVTPKVKGYKRWFNDPVEACGGYWKERGEYVTHGDFVRTFYANLKGVINSHGQTILNEKEFKKEIATFIYSLSTESAYDGYSD